MRLTRLALACVLLVGASTLVGGGQSRPPQIRDIGGSVVTPFQPTGHANVVFFVATDCPVSNSYAPEIQRVCREYGPQGVGCSLVYEDLDTRSTGAPLDQQVVAHLRDYRYEGMSAVIDRDRRLAMFARATITPQAFVVDRAGEIRYRGRIDNLYAAFGKTRQQVTRHDLRDALDAVLAGRKVSTPETEALGCFIVDPALLRTHSHE